MCRKAVSVGRVRDRNPLADRSSERYPLAVDFSVNGHEQRTRLFPASPFRRFAGSCSNQRGFLLVAAIFVIVILAMFGLLVARYITVNSVTSVEDHLWAQALYAAESAAQLRILEHDGGGNWGGSFSYPTSIAGFSITDSEVPPYAGPGNATTLTTRATHGTVISRAIEVKFIL